MEIQIVQKIFVERLTDLMQEKGYSIQELAVRTGMNRRTINGWLANKRSPQIDSLCILGDFFSCSVDFLLGRKDS
jgi:transcriptional regulator with XRE-family HTH domain